MHWFIFCFQGVFLWIPEHKWKIRSTGRLSDSLKQNSHHTFCSFLRLSSFRMLTIMQPITNPPNRCTNIYGQSCNALSSPATAEFSLPKIHETRMNNIFTTSIGPFFFEEMLFKLSAWRVWSHADTFQNGIIICHSESSRCLSAIIIGLADKHLLEGTTSMQDGTPRVKDLLCTSFREYCVLNRHFRRSWSESV